MTGIKTRKLKNEKNYQYALRMIETYGEPLTTDMAMDKNNLRFWKPTRTQMQGALHEAVRKGLAIKWRDAETKRIMYAVLGTPIPLSQNELELNEEQDTNPLSSVQEDFPPKGYEGGYDEDKHDQGMRLIEADKTLSFVEVSALYHRVPVGAIEEALLNHNRSLPADAPTCSINLKQILIKRFETFK